MAVLVGSSSTGKTRACWEAVQPLAEAGWRLWHPFDPTRAEAALADLARVGPRTVVWLNEAQHYLGAGRGLGERIAAAVHDLLTDPSRRPVVVLGTLWPEYATAYTALPRPGEDDVHSQARALLEGRLVRLPDSFDAAATAAALAMAEGGDRQLAHALEGAGDGRLTQFLAGAPALLERYENASPPARAVLEAAMDARRLGAGLHLPLAFLKHAAQDYLTDDEYDALPDNWLEQSLTELSAPVHGNLAPLRRIRPRRASPASDLGQVAVPSYRLADYLEQHGRLERRTLCPPESFWSAACEHFTDPADLSQLTDAAFARYRLLWAFRLQKTPDVRESASFNEFAWYMGHGGNAEALARQGARTGSTRALRWLAKLQGATGNLGEALTLAQQAADAGDHDAVALLCRLQEQAGDREGAVALALQAADAGNPEALLELSRIAAHYEEREWAETLASEAAATGAPEALSHLTVLLEEAGDRQGAEDLAHKAANAGEPSALLRLATLRERAGHREEAEAFARQAAEAGVPEALLRLAEIRQEAGDREGAEALARLVAKPEQPAFTQALTLLTVLREKAGEREEAEALAWQAADAGDTEALVELAEVRHDAGDREGGETLARQAADAGNTWAFLLLSDMRREAGDPAGAENVARQAADAGNAEALLRLARLRQEAGDQEAAEALARQAADAGVFGVPGFTVGLEEWIGVSVLTWWPYGLDPDGTPSDTR